MSVIYEPPCGTCGKGVRVRIETDGMGRTYDVLEQACEHERKRRGVCRHCERRVSGAVGRAAFCAGHLKLRQRKQGRQRKARRRAECAAIREADRLRAQAYYRRNAERERRLRRERYQADPDSDRAASKARYWSNPEYHRARKREARAA